MVNIVSQIDGQPSTKGDGSGLEGVDADEPPIGGSKGIERDTKHSATREVLRDVKSASNTFVETRSNDGTLSSAWDGNPASAHVVDAMDITTFLAVDPGCVC